MKVPDWVVEGATVRIPGGPLWKVAKVSASEVHIRPVGDDHACAWKVNDFLAVWEPVQLTRFEREDPI